MSSDVRETLDTTAVPVEIVPLREVVAAIVTDSKDEPQEYLDEVVVPHGGE